MKIHQYNEMMRWLTRPKEDPSIKQLAAKQIPQFGTSETYGPPEQIDMPNIQDLIREEGIQVGPQVKEGGRIYDTRKYFKPGGLVEPGVTHYATKQVKPEHGGLTRVYEHKHQMSKRKAMQIKNKLPPGVTLNWTKDSDMRAGGYWRLQARIFHNNESKFSKTIANPTGKEVNDLVKLYEKKFKAEFPNALTRNEFKILRLRDLS